MHHRRASTQALCLVLLVLSAAACRCDRLRGASPQFITDRGLESAVTFRCVPRPPGGAGRPDERAEGEAQEFPVAVVNDDFCDCEDGSDEPGTAACPNGHFFCANVGGTSPKTIPSSFVNDDVCDCCDGSDEWDSRAPCENTCGAEREAAQKEAATRAKAIRLALAKKESMVAEGRRLRKKASDDFADLEVERARQEREVAELTSRLEKLESIKESVDRRPDEPTPSPTPSPTPNPPETPDPAPGGGSVDTDGAVPDEKKTDFGDDDDDAGHHHLHHDSDYEDDDGDDDGHDDDHYMDEARESATPEPSDEVLMTAESCAALLLEPVNAFAMLKTHVLHLVSRFRGTATPMLGPNTSNRAKKKLAGECTNDVRTKKREAENKLRSVEKRFDESRKKAENSYGKDGALLASHGKCIKKRFAQYEFEHCAFEKVKQYEHGRMIASLGDFETFDEDANVMEYKNGARCWQGPPRSCKVVLVCDAEEDILRVDEPERCTYEMRFSTPAVCNASEAKRLEDIATTVQLAHDEL